MSRHGYNEGDSDNYGLWQGIISSATNGKRGQAFFRALLQALDAMPEKRLIKGELEEEGSFCALGALAHSRGADLESVDTTDWEALGSMFNIAEQLAQEVMYVNDEYDGYVRGHYDGLQWVQPPRLPVTPEGRWHAVRDWAASQIRVTADELLPLGSEAAE